MPQPLDYQTPPRTPRPPPRLSLVMALASFACPLVCLSGSLGLLILLLPTGLFLALLSLAAGWTFLDQVKSTPGAHGEATAAIAVLLAMVMAMINGLLAAVWWLAGCGR